MSARIVLLVACACLSLVACSSPFIASANSEHAADAGRYDDGAPPTMLDSSPAVPYPRVEDAGPREETAPPGVVVLDAGDETDPTIPADAGTPCSHAYPPTCGGSWIQWQCPKGYEPRASAHCSQSPHGDFLFCCYDNDTSPP